MEAIDSLLPSEAFRCISIRSLSAEEADKLSEFTSIVPGGDGLAAYITNVAPEDEARNLMRTYIVIDKTTREIVGYFSLKAGLIALDEPTQEEEPESIYTIPGIELANFAVNGAYRKAHPESEGCGLIIFNDFVVPLTQMAAQIIGAALLYIFALPSDKLIKNYQNYGFSRLEKDEEDQLHSRLKPRYDAGCIFMYMMM